MCGNAYSGRGILPTAHRSADNCSIHRANLLDPDRGTHSCSTCAHRYSDIVSDHNTNRDALVLTERGADHHADHHSTNHATNHGTVACPITAAELESDIDS